MTEPSDEIMERARDLVASEQVRFASAYGTIISDSRQIEAIARAIMEAEERGRLAGLQQAMDAALKEREYYRFPQCDEDSGSWAACGNVADAIQEMINATHARGRD